MNNIKEIETMQTNQKWIEPFMDLLNDIWWPKYAENLAKEDPEEFNRQYFYFLAQYS